MYCPTCFSNTLFLQGTGVVDIIINGKRRDSGRFLFNLDPQMYDKMVSDFETKCEEFFKWYSDFQNKDSINHIELVTLDVKCENGCKFTPGQRFSVVDIILSSQLIGEIIEKLGEKHGLSVELKR